MQEKPNTNNNDLASHHKKIIIIKVNLETTRQKKR